MISAVLGQSLWSLFHFPLASATFRSCKEGKMQWNSSQDFFSSSSWTRQASLSIALQPYPGVCTARGLPVSLDQPTHSASKSRIKREKTEDIFPCNWIGEGKSRTACKLPLQSGNAESQDMSQIERSDKRRWRVFHVVLCCLSDPLRPAGHKAQSTAMAMLQCIADDRCMIPEA